MNEVAVLGFAVVSFKGILGTALSTSFHHGFVPWHLGCFGRCPCPTEVCQCGTTFYFLFGKERTPTRGVPDGPSPSPSVTHANTSQSALSTGVARERQLLLPSQSPGQANSLSSPEFARQEISICPAQRHLDKRHPHPAVSQPQGNVDPGKGQL